MLSNEVAAEARRCVAEVVGCSTDSVVVSATHTHSGPSLRPLFGQAGASDSCVALAHPDALLHLWRFGISLAHTRPISVARL